MHVQALTSNRSKSIGIRQELVHTSAYQRVQPSERRGSDVLEEGYTEGAHGARAGVDLEPAKITCNTL